MGASRLVTPHIPSKLHSNGDLRCVRLPFAPNAKRVCQQVSALGSMVTLELSEKAPNSSVETRIVQLCLSDLNIGGIHLRYKYN
ncbi:MAG: hypothetical protein ACJAWT_001646 [Glaciecola sp.]|jgi:hypothetical protein